MYFEEKGAFTGEISPEMLTECGVTYVILGHSERRQYFGETDEMVNRKVKKALEHGLIPIICVGETLTQREEGITVEHIRIQVKKALLGLTAAQVAGLVIAYEPIWAIGTGKTATDDQAQEICAAIRQIDAFLCRDPLHFKLCVRTIQDRRDIPQLEIVVPIDQISCDICTFSIHINLMG